MTFGLKIILSLPLSLKRKYVSKQDSKGSSGNKVCPSALCCENKMDSVTRVPGDWGVKSGTSRDWESEKSWGVGKDLTQDIVCLIPGSTQTFSGYSCGSLELSDCIVSYVGHSLTNYVFI